MDAKEFQKLSAEIVGEIDRKFDIKRDVQLSLSQLVEELGELAKLVNLEKLRSRKPEKRELEDEFADVFLQLAKLADMFEVELEKAVLEKVGVLRKRHGLE
jgi:NTP pyrophosphatase (non-canonical NTP hydrolase)